MVQSSFAQSTSGDYIKRGASTMIWESVVVSDVLIVGIISAVVTLVGIITTSKNTRDSVTTKLDANQKVMNAEISHIKGDMKEMKDDIKTHNHYAQLFSENIPVMQEQLKETHRRLEDLESR